MNLSMIDGGLWAVYSTLASSYLIPLTIIIFGRNDPVGLIVGVPLLLVPLAQFAAYKILKNDVSLKKITVLSTWLDRLLWLPLLLFLYIHLGYMGTLFLFVMILSFRTFFASFSGTTWTLWVPFMIRDELRNTYFSLRNSILRIASLLGYFISLALFSMSINIRFQYTVIYILAFLFSAASLFFLNKVPDFYHRSTSDINKDRKISNKGASVVFYSILALLSLATSSSYSYYQFTLVSPGYFDLTGVQYTFILIAVSVAFVLSQMIFGRYSKNGEESRILLFSSLVYISALVCILSGLYYSYLISGILFGIGQSGFSISLFLMVIRRNWQVRSVGISLYNLIGSISQGIGLLLSNFLVSRYLSVFPVFDFSILLMIAEFILAIIYTLKY